MRRIYDQIQAVNEPYRPDRVCNLKLVNGRKKEDLYFQRLSKYS